MQRYAISANRAATYLGWFRAVAKKYPDKPASVVLADLVRHTPGEEGKWFAAAKDAKLFDEAVALANATPCDPKTLTRRPATSPRRILRLPLKRGSRPFVGSSEGYGYEVTSPRCQGRLLPHLDGRSQRRRGRGGPDPHPCPLRRSGCSQRIRRKCHREGSGPGLTRSQRRVRIADDSVREWRAAGRVPNRHTFTSDTRQPLFRGPPTRVIVLDDSVARQDTKGLPAFDL